MVCAPTNKAISVLASRFMASFHDNCNNSINVIMVGDADKLLNDERCNGYSNEQIHDNKTANLKSIFLYTWMQTVVEEYRKILSYFQPGSKRGRDLSALHNLSVQLEQRLVSSLPDLSKSLTKAATEISNILKNLKSGRAAHEIVPKLETLVKELKEIKQDAVWPTLLLNANVIFCTLSSAGGAILKKTSKIHDLIIDEAAAATEPEICVPFHLKPNRLLVVGDPLQLPATVLSRRATELGLTKSLHERLMYDCGYEHVMLEVQYRMNPEISAFPSMRFYKSKISNGGNVQSGEYQSGPILLDQCPYTFLQVDGLEEQSSNFSFHNRIEAVKVVELVTDLRRITGHVDPNWHSSERIRVITFYQSQVTLIKRLLREKGLGDKIVVATVDSSQGCEADIVLISFVRSQREDVNRHNAGFLSDDRRMNVALTRAKFQLICIGNIRGFSKMVGVETMHMLAANARERNIVRPLLRRDESRDMSSRLEIFYDSDSLTSFPSKKRKQLAY
jgi:superfamily I DNA and/or RNA helicase